MTKNNMSFVSLNLDAKTDYAAELEKTNFYEFETITINLFADNNQTIVLKFGEFDLDMFSDNKVKFNVNVKNAMSDVEYSHHYLDSLNLNECKKGEIVFEDAGSKPIKLDLDIDYINIEAQINEDEFQHLLQKVLEENHDTLQGLVDK